MCDRRWHFRILVSTPRRLYLQDYSCNSRTASGAVHLWHSNCFSNFPFWFSWLLVGAEFNTNKSCCVFPQQSEHMVSQGLERHHIRTKLGNPHDCATTEDQDGVRSILSINSCCKSFIWAMTRSLSVSSLLVSMSHGKILLVVREPPKSLSTCNSLWSHRLSASGSRLVQSALRLLMSWGSSLSDLVLFVERQVTCWLFELYKGLVLFLTVVCHSNNPDPCEVDTSSCSSPDIRPTSHPTFPNHPDQPRPNSRI